MKRLFPCVVLKNIKVPCKKITKNLTLILSKTAYRHFEAFSTHQYLHTDTEKTIGKTFCLLCIFISSYIYECKGGSLEVRCMVQLHQNPGLSLVLHLKSNSSGSN